MKKRDLIFAAALLLGFSLGARAQTAEETLFFYGFEDELASFRDSTAVVDSITQIRYYAGNPNSAGFEIVYTKDSLMYLFNSISTVRSDARTDTYELVTDPIGTHKGEMQELGAEGGDSYFKYTSGGEGSELCADYKANLFVRGLKLEPFTSYRLVFYSKGSHPEANLQAGVFRGYYNSEKSISLNGGSGNEFRLEKTEFTTDRWERNTLMMFYQYDSVANAHMYNAGYWWTNSWATTDTVTGKSYNQIEQFDKYFMRMSFRYPGRTYYIDDISLYKSTIGGAEFNGDVLRVNFGYQTNLAELAKKDQAMKGIKERVSKALVGFEGKGLTVQQREGKIYVSLENKLLFPSGSTVVDQQGRDALQKLAKAIENEKDLNILVEGHTDTDKVLPGASYKDNWDLSVMRATSVVRILQEGTRLDPKRVTAGGRGEYIPLDPNDKAKNRRIEIILAPDLRELYDLVKD